MMGWREGAGHRRRRRHVEEHTRILSEYFLSSCFPLLPVLTAARNDDSRPWSQTKYFCSSNVSCGHRSVSVVSLSLSVCLSVYRSFFLSTRFHLFLFALVSCVLFSFHFCTRCMRGFGSGVTSVTLMKGWGVERVEDDWCENDHAAW